MSRRKLADIKADVWAELKRGENIVEADLRDPKYHLDGLCTDRTVYVDPRPGVVEAATHEILHRIFPAWSEDRVYKTAYRILCKLNATELKRWHKQYQRVARKRVTPLNPELDS